MALASPGTFWACQIFLSSHFCHQVAPLHALVVFRFVLRSDSEIQNSNKWSFWDPELQQIDRSDFQNARLAQVAHSLARHPTYWNSIRAEQDSPAVGAAAEVLPNSDNVSLWTVFSEDDSPVAKKNKSLTVSVGQPQARSRNSISPSSGHKDLTPVD